MAGWSTGSCWSAAPTPTTRASWLAGPRRVGRTGAHPEIRRLVDAVAARYAGTRPDVLRLPCRPPRQGGAGAVVSRDRRPGDPGPVDPRAGTATGGRSIPGRPGRVAAAGRLAGAAGEPWTDRFAEAAAQTVRPAGPRWRSFRPARPGRPVAAATTRIDEGSVVALSAGLARARYRRWLAALRAPRGW
ncbi:putative primosomal protein N' [Mycobacterium intracellulare MIN_061107_1834]|nr:putative primosomal protein N' [Mycobacterium intracellulare MIN_061107_1834]